MPGGSSQNILSTCCCFHLRALLTGSEDSGSREGRTTTELLWSTASGGAEQNGRDQTTRWGACRVQRLRAVDEEAALLCERLASNAAASSRSMWATSAASCARSHACGAQPSLHVGGLRSASSAWAVKGRLARPWSGSAAGQISSLGWRHGWRAQRPWTSAVLLHVRRSHGGTAGSVAGMRPALLPHSLSHKAWLHWQLQRLGQPQLQQGAPAAAWRDLSWGGVRAWNSYSMTSYTPKLPHWFRSRLPDMPEGERP